MKQSRRRFSAEFKAKVALEALREHSSLSELSAKYEIHPNQISEWKRQAIEQMSSVFGRSSQTQEESQSRTQEASDRLYAKIGQLEMERDFLKKSLLKSGYPIKERS
jgi:transposase